MSAAILINADLVNADLRDAEAERDAWEPVDPADRWDQ